MKLIIAGSRNMKLKYELIEHLLINFKINDIDEIISGGATGVDSSGENFAKIYDIPIKKFEANWNIHGKAAGPIRNKQMAEYANALLLIWDGQSKGSTSMKQCAIDNNLLIYEVIMK